MLQFGQFYLLECFLMPWQRGNFWYLGNHHTFLPSLKRTFLFIVLHQNLLKKKQTRKKDRLLSNKIYSLDVFHQKKNYFYRIKSE